MRMWWVYTIVIIYLTDLTTGDQPRIIIVGAGASGVAAASKLFENGFNNITILEAEDRIGGRVYTTRFDDRWIDLGAQWVHGQTNNVVFELASPLGVLEVPEEENFAWLVYDSKGQQIPNSISNDFIQLLMNLSETSSDNFEGNNGSAGEWFTNMITTEARKFPEAHQSFTRQFIKVSEELQNVLDGADNWYNTSARGYLEYTACPGNNEVTWMYKGYSTILDILMKKYPNPENELPILNNTILNSEVSNINYNSTEGKVLVESSNGEKYTADHVIVTPSLGVLKEEYETLFTPALPESKVKTIKGLSMGTLAKIYFSFESEWWPSNVTGFIFVWNENERQEYEADPDKKWLLRLIGIYTVSHKPRMLMGWLIGQGASYMETLPEDQVANQTFAILNRFLGQSYNVTRPTGVLRSKWISNKHFRGTYSFRSMESERADAWGAELAAPIMVNGQPAVMFAGEATNPHHYSTVHGAIETGFREANRLIDIYNNTLN